MTNSYIALDLETTELKARLDGIAEIVVLRMEDGRVEEGFVTSVNPGRQLREGITALAGITDDVVRDAFVIENTIGNVARFRGSLPLLGHSVLLGYTLLRRAVVNSGLDSKREGTDTPGIYRLFMPEDVKRGLICACSFYEASQSTAHRAQTGTGAAHRLYQMMMTRRGEEHPGAFAAESLVYKAKRE